jgi:hypothetical protein
MLNLLFVVRVLVLGELLCHQGKTNDRVDYLLMQQR